MRMIPISSIGLIDWVLLFKKKIFTTPTIKKQYLVLSCISWSLASRKQFYMVTDYWSDFLNFLFASIDYGDTFSPSICKSSLHIEMFNSLSGTVYVLNIFPTFRSNPSKFPFLYLFWCHVYKCVSTQCVCVCVYLSLVLFWLCCCSNLSVVYLFILF